MMQKRTMYSLLLTSFILVFAFSVASAQNTVTFESKTVARCEANVLNIDVTNAADISAFEIVFEINSTAGGAFFDAVNVSWDAGLTSLTNRVVDLSGVDYVSPDTVRIAGMLTDPGDACLAGGTTTVAQVEFTTNDACAGTVALDGAVFTCPTNPLVVAQTQFIDCATTTVVAASVVAGTVTIQNQAPTIDPIADATVHWGDTYIGQATGDDPDLHTTPGGCESLTYALVSGPAGFNVNANGAMTWTTGGADVCNPDPILVEIIDQCGGADTTSFNICVYNDPPTITCPTDTVHIIWGETAMGTVVGNDPDGGPSPLMYTVASFSGPGTPTINAATGAWEWPTLEENGYQGLFELCLAVSDGANTCDPCSPENADTCCVYIRVIPTMSVYIEKTHGTFQGQPEEVSIYLDSTIQPADEMGGFDFLISYDASALTFQSAEPGQLLLDCGWEYFTFRYGPNGNCGPGACPSGMLRIVSIAETNNGANHPSCFTGTAGQLALLHFLVTNDRNYECQYVPIRWMWYDCGDNAISSVSGDTLYISRHVYEFEDTLGLNPIENDTMSFPTMFGAPAVCDIDTGDGKPDPERVIDFWNGGIDIACADSIDARGDLNLNGLAYEIADAVLYSNYFVHGLGVFNINLQGQTAASDVNADGIPLSVGDLVYLTRVIVGDALPYPKVVTPVNVQLVNHDGTLTITSDVPMGAAYVVAEGSVTPTLLADEMDIKYAYDAEQNVTRILVYSIGTGSFTGEFLHVPGTITSMELATYQGHPVKLDMVPAEFSLNQNYPNPFNPSTTISFGLPVASEYNLTIFNITGQEVAHFSGSAEAGIVEIEWDANNLASGVYFYRLDVGSFSDTKKMVLLK